MHRTHLLFIWATALVALAVSGCGSSAHTPARSATTGRTPTTSTTSTTPTTPATQPTSTTSTTSTTAVPLPGTGRPAVQIGDKNFGEQFILGELYRWALVAQGYTATLNRNIGPTEVTIQALLSRRLDFYPEYLNVWNADVAGDRRRFSSSAQALTAARRHAARRGLALLDPTPFSDTQAVAVTPALAAADNLRSIADLAPIAENLTFGGPLPFQTSEPGLPTLARAYGVTPAAFKPLDVGDQIDALDRGSVEATAVGTTDGQLQVGHAVLLDDPKHIFGFGNVVPVVPRRVLAAEGPAFARTINAVSALLTLPVIRQLNEDVELSGQDPGTVARRFLQANGLLPPG